MRLIVSCNGPGETAGWLRPVLTRLYERKPDADVHVFFVPDDYATGREPAYVRTLFPQAHVYDTRAYVRIALGGSLPAVPAGAEGVLYLGGDLMHAGRLLRRFGGALMTYKFSRPRYAGKTLRAFAVDSANAQELQATGVPPERVAIVGNLAVDGALSEAALPPDPGSPPGGLLIMPGSRDYELQNMLPFFFTAALWIRRDEPALPIAFAISPFTDMRDVAAAIDAGGDPRMFAHRGRFVAGDVPLIASMDGSAHFPIVRNAMAAAHQARMALTIPGTKVIELAALGTPCITCSPLNAAELVAFNGPLTYLNRVPVVGAPIKRAIAAGISRRHRFHAQPNIDAGEEIVKELHGTLTPGRVARVALERWRDDRWLQEARGILRTRYARNAGAAERIAEGIVSALSAQAA